MERLLTLYSEVQSTDVRWLWYPFIAIGKITLLQGDPGDGKSTMMMNLIAELSTGGKTPDGCKIGAPQKVIYQCSEDGVSDTIKPRLERCGADCRKIAFINEEVYNGLTLDDERIRQAIIEFRPRLVVIDPIQAYLGSDSDLQIAGRARKLMRRLGMWAAGYDCAIVLIGHLNKKEGCNGVQREHNKKLNNGLPILHKVPPKRDYGRYFCIMAEKGGTSHGGLTEKLSPFFHAKKQEVNAYGR